MRLLFDHNLSPMLPSILHDLYPQSMHVYAIGLEESDDIAVWEYAEVNGLVIVTKDADYLAISTRRGHSPKVIRIGLGNCSTAAVAELLRFHNAELLLFHQDERGAFIRTAVTLPDSRPHTTQHPACRTIATPPPSPPTESRTNATARAQPDPSNPSHTVPRQPPPSPVAP